MQRFCKEVLAWRTLQHPNVLPLIGVSISETRFVMVSEWMVNGNLNEFVKKNPDANRLELVRFSFGIYLYSEQIDNGVTDPAGRCC